MISNVPFSHTDPTKLRPEGAGSLTDSEALSVDVFWASPDYFRVLNIPLKRDVIFLAEAGEGSGSAGGIDFRLRGCAIQAGVRGRDP